MHRTTNRRIVCVGLALALLFFSANCVCQNSANNQDPALLAAKKALARGELDQAEQQLWKVLSSNPDQSEALNLLGIIRGQQKRYPEAEALFRRVLQLDPKAVETHRNLANSLLVQNKTTEAIDEYTILTKLAPDDTQLRIQLAHLYLVSGKFSDALSTLDQVKANRFPVDAVPLKAAALLGLGKTKEASLLIPLAVKSPDIAADLAEVFLEGGAPEYALKVIEGTQNGAQPMSARLLYLRGRALAVTGNQTAALVSLQQSLTRSPKSVDTLLALASAYSSQSEHGKSMELLQRANALEPNSPRVLRPLVIEGMKTGNHAAALNAAHSLATRSPDNLDDQYVAAAAMLEAKDDVTAAQIFEKYVQARSNDAKAFLGLGVAQLSQRKYPEARTALERALEIDPNLADAEYELAMVAEQQGATDEAFQRLERTVQLQPQHAMALASLGAHYLQTGDLDKARGFLERSVAVNPNNFKSQYDFGLVLAKLGRNDEAQQHLERSQSLRNAEDLGKSPRSGSVHP